MSFKGLRGFKQSSVLSPKIRKMAESGLTPVRPLNTTLVPTLVLSFTSVDEGSATGRYVGTPYVVNGKGTYTITEIADPDNKFTITGGDLVTSASLDYGVKTSHLVTLRASNGVDTDIDQQFTINVNNVFENALGPVSANFYYLVAENAVITTITGLDSEVAESIAAISPNDGRLAFNANQILKGPSAVTEGVINAIVTTTQGRTLEIALTALDASWANIGALFNDGAIDGLMIDLTDKTTLFQDTNGAAAVVSNGDPIGLALDQHKWGGKTLAEYRAAQSELAANFDFATDISGWTIKNGSAVWSSGKMRLTASTGSQPASEQLITGLTSGRWYEVTFVSSGRQSGTGTQVGFSVGTTASVANNLAYQEVGIAAGTFRRFFKAMATSLYFQFFGAGTSGSVTDVESFSVKEIDGHHATQILTARPTWASATSDVLFDGSNDYLTTTDFYFRDKGNHMAAWAAFGASGATRMVMGAYHSSSSESAVIQVTSAGLLQSYAGGSSPLLNSAVNVASTTKTVLVDQQTADAQMSIDGAGVTFGATPGDMPDAARIIPVFIGAQNNNGSTNLFFNGRIKRIVAGQVRVQDTMTAAEFHQNLIAP